MKDDFQQAKEGIPVQGFLKYAEATIPKGESLFSAIEELKKDKKAIVLADIYQSEDIKSKADFSGKDLELIRKAEESEASLVAVCGRKGLAESIKILFPQKKVVVPDLLAGNYTLRQLSGFDVQKIRSKNPEAIIITSLDADADTKAESDWVAASENLVEIIHSIGNEKPIIFASHMKLQDYLQQTGEINIQTLEKDFPEKYPADRNTWEKVYLCLKYELPEITIPEEIAEKAKEPLNKMMKIK